MVFEVNRASFEAYFTTFVVKRPRFIVAVPEPVVPCKISTGSPDGSPSVV